MIRHSMTGSMLGPPSDFQKCLPLRSSEIRRSALIAVAAQYAHPPRLLLLQSRLTPLCPVPLFVSGEFYFLSAALAMGLVSMMIFSIIVISMNS